MKINKIQKGLVLATVSLGMFVAGCELIVDFDRTRIPVALPDATTGDANVPDTGATGDAGNDGAVQEELDAGDDAAVDLDAGDASDGNDGAI